MTAESFVLQEADVALEGWDDPVRGRVAWRTLVSGDRTPSEGMTIGVAEVLEADPATFRPHRHAQAETYYVLSGEGVMLLDGGEHRLRAGSVVFIPGGVMHGARGLGPEPLRLLYVLAADRFDEVVYEFPDETPGV